MLFLAPSILALLSSATAIALLRDDTTSTTTTSTSTSTSTPTITLDYATLQPYASGTTSAGGYYHFKNIRYAAPPTGDLRWAAPQDPLVETEINNGTSPSSGEDTCKASEDCLFLDVWAPASAVEGGESLPVLFWNYGGGWTGGSKNEQTPEGLLQASNNGIVFVAYNYRLDIFGVLNGPTLQRSGGISNVAVYDAHKAMEWTYTYISQFGGDPEEITNWGFSAGGSQVAVSLTAFGGHEWTPRFKRAIINSPGWVPGAGHQHADEFLKNVTESVDCTFNTAETIDCLKNVTFSTLLAASENITSTYGYQMQPRVDGVVLPDTSEYLWSIGQHHPNVSLLIGHSAHESNSQAFSGVSNTTASYRAKFKAIFPAITDSAIDEIEALYPESNYTSQGLRYAAAAQHYDLVGKVLPATNANGNQTWNYFNDLGTATHGSDQSYWWYYNGTSSESSTTSSSSTGTSSGSMSNSSSISSSSGSAGSASASASAQATMSGSAPSSSSSSSSSSTSSNSTTTSSGPGGSSSSSSGGGMSSSTTTEWIALRMQAYLLSFVITGNPNNLYTNSSDQVSSWPQYGSEDNVVEFSSTGFSLVGDELDSAQVVFWNKAYWY